MLLSELSIFKIKPGIKVKAEGNVAKGLYKDHVGEIVGVEIKLTAHKDNRPQKMAWVTVEWVGERRRTITYPITSFKFFKILEEAPSVDAAPIQEASNIQLSLQDVMDNIKR